MEVYDSQSFLSDYVRGEKKIVVNAQNEGRIIQIVQESSSFLIPCFFKNDTVPLT